MTAAPFMAIAHRGASSYAPENTFAAFDLALRMGARHIELDVETTADGHVVVIHDDTVDRTTDGSGPVAGHTLQRLQGLDAGSWFGAAFAGERIPLFTDVLARYQGRVHIHVEIKGRTADLSHRTAALVRRHGMVEQVTITSFQKARLEEIRGHAPELAAGWLVPEVDDAVIAQARDLGLRQLCPRASTVTPDLVRRLHAEGFVVRAWGVATDALMRQVVEAGADGMTVNFPDRLLAYLSGRERQASPINLAQKFAKFSHHWSPKIIAAMNDYQLKLVKFQGEFVWHDHQETDEVFIVVEGAMTIHFRDRDVRVQKGELFVIPRGLEHKTSATAECWAMLVERAGTVNTGAAGGDKTAATDAWI